MLIGTKRSIFGTRFVDDQYSRRIQEFSANLVAHWPLDDQAGAVAVDKSGNGNHGAITGTTLGQPGIGDGLKSQYFDGANDYIDISAVASNLIANGGFETAGAGEADVHASWTEHASDGAIANEAGTVHTGSDALKLTAGAGKDTYDDQNVTVVAGSTNNVRLWVYGDASDEGQYSIYDNDNAGDIVATTGIGETAAEWNMVDISFDAPAGCTSARIRLQCPDANGGIVYFDTVSVRRTDIPTFDPHEGSMIVWAKVSDWEDGAERYIIRLRADGANQIQIRKDIANNNLRFWHEANNVVVNYIKTYSNTAWFPVGFTWSLSGDLTAYYLDGTQDSTDSGLGVFTGNLDATYMIVGAGSSGPAVAHNGNLAHAQLYNTPHSADEMAYLMRRPS